ncbi:hypothetical protein DPMN_042051 [Dreissena polymorpha]|uniref:Uncharacterized protein n=1 Tax=Dreissena polymorpha TaxID=45954 RepID=A0A9D4HWQ0_DREPO|nr:hypothetical protein DPMN_042051 [Dreissena polymorpha]
MSIDEYNLIRTKKLSHPPWRQCFLTDRDHFRTFLDINKTNRFTKFHDDWAKHITSTATNVLTKFHENLAKNVTSIVFTCFHYIHIEKTTLPTGGHVFFTDLDHFRTRPMISIKSMFDDDWAKNENCPVPVVATFFNGPEPFSNLSHISNVLTKFHEDWTKNVTSRVFTCFHYNIHKAKTAPPFGGHNQYLTKKHAPPTGGHVFQRTGTAFKLNEDIMKTNVLKTFKLDRGIIGTNLTKFHKDRTINVVSRVFTTQCGRTEDGRTEDGRTDDGQRTIPKAHLSNQNKMAMNQ